MRYATPHTVSSSTGCSSCHESSVASRLCISHRSRELVPVLCSDHCDNSSRGVFRSTMINRRLGEPPKHALDVTRFLLDGMWAAAQPGATSFVTRPKDSRRLPNQAAIPEDPVRRQWRFNGTTARVWHTERRMGRAAMRTVFRLVRASDETRSNRNGTKYW